MANNAANISKDELIEPSTKKLKLSDMKLSENKILRLDSDNIRSCHRDVKVILIENCTNFNYIQSLLRGFKLDNFPNAFILCVEVEDDATDTVESIANEINKKLDKTQQILLQINYEVFLREEKKKKFKRVKLLNNEEVKSSFEASKFSIEVFLSILKETKIFEANLNVLLKYEENFTKILSNSITSQDDFCIRLLDLFDIRLPIDAQNEVFSSLTQSKNFKSFKAFLAAIQFSDQNTDKFFLEALEFLVKNKASDAFYDLKEIYGNLRIKVFTTIENQSIDKLHENIKNGKFDEVKEFVGFFKDQKFCYGSKSVCALEYAIDCRQFEIYSFLRAKGFYTDRGSELDKKIEKLSKNQKEKIRIENLKYIKDLEFIGILLSKCKFDVNSPVSVTEVQQMLTELSKNDDLKTLLTIASQSNVKIIFDFSTESIRRMDPNGDGSTMGMAYYWRHEIYVGRDEDDSSRYGTFAHELCHYVLSLIYDNRCLPYCKDDIEREREWDIILNEEKEKIKEYENRFIDIVRRFAQSQDDDKFHNLLVLIENSDRKYDAIAYYRNVGEWREIFDELDATFNYHPAEEIIRWISFYDPGYEQRVELAVRPYHIMARYLSDVNIIQQIEGNHPKLIKFFNKVILRDLQIPNVLRLIVLNENFEVTQRVEEFNIKIKKIDNSEIFNNEHKRLVVTSKIPKLALAKLHQEIKTFSPNKLDIKVKNIFVDVEKLQQICYRCEFENLVETSNLERIIFDVTDERDIEQAFKYLKNFNTQAQVIVVCHESNASQFVDELNYIRLPIDIKFENLTEGSKNMLRKKKINFQGKDLKVSKFLNIVSIEHILPLLCKDEKVTINFDEKLKLDENLIAREIENDGKKSPLQDFAKSVQNNRVVVISDDAGTGKTTLLLQIGEYLLEQYSKYWISFVSLRDYLEQISENLKDNFEGDFESVFAKILNLNTLENLIFTKKFKSGEVKILFDAFDEISPKAKNETIKLFELFLKQSKNQIWITTRPHLKEDLKEKLNVNTYKLIKLSQEEQVNFLCRQWKGSHDNVDFIKNCAVELTQKIATMIQDHDNLVGVPIVVKSLAELFQNKLDKNFSNEVKNLKITKVYSRILEKFLRELALRFPLMLFEAASKELNIIQTLKFLAIRHYFSENFANSLGFYHDDDEYPYEEIARSGLITLDKNNEVKFNHETYGEFILTLILKNILKHQEKLSGEQIELVAKVLKEERFKVTRMFLKEMLDKDAEKMVSLFQKEENSKIFDRLEDNNIARFSQTLLNLNLEEPNIVRSILLNKVFKVCKEINAEDSHLRSIDGIELINKNENKIILTTNIHELALLKLNHEIKNFTQNNIELKLQTIHVDFEVLEAFKSDAKKLLEFPGINRIIFDAPNTIKVEMAFQCLKNLNSNAQIIVICDNIASTNFVQSLNYNHVPIEFKFNDLTEKTQQKILGKSIQYQGTFCHIENFLSNLSADCLSFVWHNEEISINSKHTAKIENDLFMPRIIERENEKFSIERLIQNNDKIVLINDVPGSGKTIMLRKVQEIFLDSYQSLWISFVSLLEHKKILLDSYEITDNFVELMANKVLQLNVLEREIFESKYYKNEVVILFDGFDEISPDCKQNVLKIFKLHKKSGKSQIWITSRTHLEADLRRELQVETYKIVPLNEEEQIKFLCKSWKETCDDANLRDKSAKVLVRKLSKFCKSDSILQVQLLGEYFKNHIDMISVHNAFNDFELCEFLIENRLKVKNPDALHSIFNLHFTYCESFALRNCTNDSEEEIRVHLFGRASFIEDVIPEMLARDGIISYDQNGEIFFVSQIFEEFFVSRFLLNRIKYFKKDWKYESEFFEFLTKILWVKKYENVRMLLDRSLVIKSLLETNFEQNSKKEEDKSLQNFTEALNSFVIINNRFNFFDGAVHKGFSEFSLFLLKCIKYQSAETFQNIIESQNEMSSLLSGTISALKDKRLSESLRETFEI